MFDIDFCFILLTFVKKKKSPAIYFFMQKYIEQLQQNLVDTSVVRAGLLVWFTSYCASVVKVSTPCVAYS